MNVINLIVRSSKSLQVVVLVRHGETEGESSIRFHGSTDVPLSELGRAQMSETSRGLAREAFDLVVASPLSRAWVSARILSGGSPVRLERDFREIDFGRWEGLTKEEIEVTDPVLYGDWQDRVAGFDFPGGEPRAEFTKRVLRGFEGLEQGRARSVLVVAHKGIVRTVAEKLLGAALPHGEPPLAGWLGFSQGADAIWRAGRRSSNP
jgi:broad specificity phosphatase PhoE